jgi:WD40 repeat protein
MGVVYEAELESLGRHVALKVLPAHARLDPRHLLRFKREARAAAKLHHSNIVPVHGVGEQDGVHYYVMQFIRGQGLDQVLGELRQLRRGRRPADRTPAGTEQSAAAEAARSLLSGRSASPLAEGGSGTASGIHLPGQSDGTSLSDAGWPYWQSVARVGLQVADALSYAASQGVLHRDIKPANLLLDTRGTVWVTDFGLAKAETDGDDVTHTGDVVGTLRYMAPERFAGAADVRSDVYALGLTLYELLTLRPAFDEADRNKLVARVLHDHPPPPRQLDRAVPRDLETIILKAIEKEPARRYQTPAELADDLQRFLDDRPIKARRLGPVQRARRWCRRNPWVAGLTAAVFALLLAVAVGSPIMLVNLRDEQAETVKQLRRAERAEREARERLRDSYRAQAQARRWSGRPGRHFLSLEAIREAALIRPSRDLRDEAVACMPLADLRVGLRRACRPPGTEQNHYVAVDAALERYAVAADGGGVSVRRLADDRELRRLPAPDPGAGNLVFSPDGRFLARRGGTAVVVWEVATGEVVVRVPTPDAECIYAQAFSPDGRRVAVGVGDATVRVWDLASRTEIVRLATPARPEAVAFRPLVPHLAVSSLDRNELQVFSLESGRELFRLAHPESLCGVAWTPDGKVLAAASGSNVQIWDAVGGAPRAVLKGHQSRVMECAFSHGGGLLATRSWDGTTRLWDPGSGNQLVATGGHYLRFGPDDRRLAFADDTDIGVWEVADGRMCRTLPACGAADEEVWAVDVSPDGRLLAAGGKGGIRLWELAGGRELARLPTGSTYLAAFTPDGDGLITCGSGGVHHRPITARGDALHVGAPRLLFGGERPRLESAASRDRKRVAVVTGPGQVTVFDTGAPGRAAVLDGHPGVLRPSLSPDGRWAATGTQHGKGIKVWDVRTGRVEKEIPAAGYGWAVFSPDGRRLVTGSWGHETCSWAVESWEPQGRWPPAGGAAFSHDGKQLALAYNGVTLVDPESAAELATLTPPHPLPVTSLCFAPGGDRLVVGCNNRRATQVWDLRALRGRLKEMNLDWDRPDYPPPAAGPGPLRVELTLWDLTVPGLR